MKLFTMGFTKKSAEQFFGRLKQAGLKRVVDTRLNNVSQLAGFTKKDDLKFFLKEVLEIDYVHAPLLAPSKDILDDYKKNGGDWPTYERKFLDLTMAPTRLSPRRCWIFWIDMPHMPPFSAWANKRHVIRSYAGKSSAVAMPWKTIASATATLFPCWVRVGSCAN